MLIECHCLFYKHTHVLADNLKKQLMKDYVYTEVHPMFCK